MTPFNASARCSAERPAFYAVATIITLVVLQQKAKTGSHLFAGTLSVLSKDSAALAEKFEANDLNFHVNRRPGRD